VQFFSEEHLEDGILERRFAIDQVPGILWTRGSAPAPLVLLGHPGGLAPMHPRLAARARGTVAAGFAAATLELPGSGDRPRSAHLDQARADLRLALRNGSPVAEEVVDRLVLPLVEQAVPEMLTALDVLQDRPEIEPGPAAIAGGVISIGVGLAAAEPRIAAAVLFAGSLIPRSILALARQVTVPVQMLLQWDDEHNDRHRSLELFDAFGSQQATLHANRGGHTGVPVFEAEAADRFLARHLL